MGNRAQRPQHHPAIVTIIAHLGWIFMSVSVTFLVYSFARYKFAEPRIEYVEKEVATPVMVPGPERRVPGPERVINVRDTEVEDGLRQKLADERATSKRRINDLIVSLQVAESKGEKLEASLSRCEANLVAARGADFAALDGELRELRKRLKDAARATALLDESRRRLSNLDVSIVGRKLNWAQIQTEFKLLQRKVLAAHTIMKRAAPVPEK